ncbi:MAG: hypothetical protein NTZ97_00470 [Candidatus Moranbacteria bacterium]|nr:hypothetical protein [Candidatus Moranbacteria bacterium]
MTFEKFNFSQKQISQYYDSAVRDFKIASESDVPEVSFRFCYDAILKLAIAVCARNGLRVKSKRGHHIELIHKLSEMINYPEIEVIGNEMRSKRNFDLYGGGTLISKKEAKSYIEWTRDIFKKVDEYLHNKSRLF